VSGATKVHSELFARHLHVQVQVQVNLYVSDTDMTIVSVMFEKDGHSICVSSDVLTDVVVPGFLKVGHNN